MSKYHKKSHCKYRKNIINGIFRDDLLQILYDISLEKGFMIDTPPQISVQQIVHQLKQISTYRIYQTHRRYLKQYYWKENTLFSDGYFACSTGDASSETIRKYIEEQG